METQLNPNLLTGPIPGMSLTSEPGAYPWENPSQLNTLDEAVEYYSEKILQPEVEDKVLIALDDGTSAEKLAEMLAISGTMNGIHSLDIAYIIMPYIKELAICVTLFIVIGDFISLEDDQKAGVAVPNR